MVLKMNPTISVLVFLLVGGFCINCGELWCYDKPDCDPNTWASLGYCGGKKQSPINIVTRKALSDSSLGHIRFLGYEDRMKPKVLKNTGHYPDIRMASGASISSPGLPGTYALKSFHFHWGTYMYPGSEHAIDGLQYPMELHIVHTKNNMSEEEAKKDPEGFAVLGFFLKKSSKAPIVSAWKTLGKFLERIPEKGNSVNLHGEFSLGALLNTVDTKTYYRYHGSLTTPDCNEAVIWTIFPEPIEIHHTVFKRFTKSMYFTNKKEKRPMQNNYRPLQFLNNRKVLRFTEK
ncbi:carbonic anhydrase 4-like [Varanus komodoensis]|uniref:carbonic anhydrase 4-like n=1 Tax=Varanus komodoensis TaxID=61221 RepID=UPI001CF7AD07|nr:carbonic anhydrase 4-like [Varanus komodoensis]